MSKFNIPPPPLDLKLNIAAFVKVFVLAAFLVAAVQPSAFAEWKNLEVVNHTGFDIKRLYISSSGSGVWGKDLLGSKILKNGDTKTISYNGEYRYYDLKIVFMNDTYREWTGDHRCDFKNAWRMTIYNSGRRGSNGMIFTVSMN